MKLFVKKFDFLWLNLFNDLSQLDVNSVFYTDPMFLIDLGKTHSCFSLEMFRLLENHLFIVEDTIFLVIVMSIVVCSFFVDWEVAFDRRSLLIFFNPNFVKNRRP